MDSYVFSANELNFLKNSKKLTIIRCHNIANNSDIDYYTFVKYNNNIVAIPTEYWGYGISSGQATQNKFYIDRNNGRTTKSSEFMASLAGPKQSPAASAEELKGLWYGTSAEYKVLNSEQFRPAYSANLTYVVGDTVSYKGKFYICKTAISTAEAWTAAHWLLVESFPQIVELSGLSGTATTDQIAILSSDIAIIHNPYTSEYFRKSCLVGNQLCYDVSRVQSNRALNRVSLHGCVINTATGAYEIYRDNVDLVSANPVLVGTESEITSIKIGATDYKLPRTPLTADITWSELKALRDVAKLIPGTLYRITDYRTYALGTNITCANHDFDIIVLALDTDSISEKAWATSHTGDIYFANSKLDAWEIWYCLDNDGNRFGWADTTNGKGIIYRMIDEFGNDVPYDFKNILINTKYVFNRISSSQNADASLLASEKCYANKIAPYHINGIQTLNNNIFESSVEGAALQCFNNVLGPGCFGNILKNGCTNNIFDSECNSITLGTGSKYNKLGIQCNNVILGSDALNNTLGNNCDYIYVGNYSINNIFENNCSNIIFGTATNETIAYCKNITIEAGCEYINLISTDTVSSSSNYLQNICVNAGVKGTSAERKIITIPDRNLDYTTDVYASGSTEMYI